MQTAALPLRLARIPRVKLRWLLENGDSSNEWFDSFRFYSKKKSINMLCSAYSHQRTMLLYSTFPHSKRWKRKWQQNYYWMTFIQGTIFEEEVNIAEVQSLLPWVLFVLLFYSSPHKSRRINVYPRVTGDPRKLWIYIIITHAVWNQNKAQHLNVRWMCKRVWLSELILLLNV